MQPLTSVETFCEPLETGLKGCARAAVTLSVKGCVCAADKDASFGGLQTSKYLLLEYVSLRNLPPALRSATTRPRSSKLLIALWTVTRSRLRSSASVLIDGKVSRQPVAAELFCRNQSFSKSRSPA